MVMVAPVMGETHARRPPSAEAVTLLPSPALDWLPSVQDWADQQFGTLDLGDVRLNRRALAMAQKMAARPQASLPKQMGSPSAPMAAYRLLNNPRVSLAALLNPPIQHTLAAAGQAKVVLLPEDPTELGYPRHPCKKGLGPGSAEYAQGLLLHSTLAVVPGTRLVLGLAHVQVIVREPVAQPNRHRRHKPEGQVWQVSAEQVGRPPAGTLWVHVSDRESDIFAYLATCLDLGQHFLVRAYQNRAVVWGRRNGTHRRRTAGLADGLCATAAGPADGRLRRRRAGDPDAARPHGPGGVAVGPAQAAAGLA